MTADHAVDRPHDPGADPATQQAQREPDWWHRDHPTFTALTGFFTGLVFAIVVPGAFGAALNALFDYHVAEDLFPLVLVALVAPAGLVLAPRTRRFGIHMVIGIVTTLLVVVGVALLVLWYMLKFQG